MSTDKITAAEYSGFQEAYDWFNVALFAGTLPDVLITLARRANTYGYFSAKRFDHRAEAEKTTSEICLNPDAFVGRTDAAILSTLVHARVTPWANPWKVIEGIPQIHRLAQDGGILCCHPTLPVIARFESYRKEAILEPSHNEGTHPAGSSVADDNGGLDVCPLPDDAARGHADGHGAASAGDDGGDGEPGGGQLRHRRPLDAPETSESAGDGGLS